MLSEWNTTFLFVEEDLRWFWSVWSVWFSLIDWNIFWLIDQLYFVCLRWGSPCVFEIGSFCFSEFGVSDCLFNKFDPLIADVFIFKAHCYLPFWSDNLHIDFITETRSFNETSYSGDHLERDGQLRLLWEFGFGLIDIYRKDVGI